ncbi:hypothetical protein GCM10023321_58710 [Pseudonocardia eucalypti]|uniref:Uncharacterized protein n=1 Tax=Pseudonocardia eucalypti TaxID=648755 RepID=A0ABP9QSP2_9PSEU|nr:hypothetical protein [Pseudonocardia eucalypti]
MSITQYAIGAVAAAGVTSMELIFRSQRHPFGDRKMKAVGWWLAVAALDAGVACAMLAGAVGIELVDPATVDHGNELLKALVIGGLGPLALRSPVRKTKVKDQDSTVGMTYVYDIARLYALYALDERYVRLKRNDVRKTRAHWKALGLDSRKVAAAIRRHLTDHDRLDIEKRDAITAGVANSMTLPTEDERLSALIKLINLSRFSALCDELSAYRESADASELEIDSLEPGEGDVVVIEVDVDPEQV